MNAFVAGFDEPAAGQRVREASDARLRNKASIRHLLPSHLLASRWRHIDRARQEVPSAVTGGDGRDGGYADPNLAHSRSEEHTSELQSLMRISYAVFCWKKKNTKK